MTVFQQIDCKVTPSSKAHVFQLAADNCVNFPSPASCVVVSSIEDDGTCPLRDVSC
ncbi:hypothetical protein F5Y04DRAFT_246529 [Hypomontagnella monticulosa]|nr:hypothetical protein F5Y04DRAFT_246529 [Hypomontagnella monticulosa]